MTIPSDDITEFFEKGAYYKDKPKKWRRNGKTKTWVTRPGEFSIPVKFGAIPLCLCDT